MLKTILPALVLGTLLTMMLGGCGSAPESTPAPETDANGVPINRIEARYAIALARDLETLVSSMDTYFVGEIISEGKQRSVGVNGGSRPGIPLSVFSVRVQRSAGVPATGSIVEFEQFGGLVSGPGGQVRLLLEGDTPLVIGRTYMFVAKESQPGTYSASPFARFPVTNGRLDAPSGWEDTGASRQAAGLTVESAMDRLAQR